VSLALMVAVLHAAPMQHDRDAAAIRSVAQRSSAMTRYAAARSRGGGSHVRADKKEALEGPHWFLNRAEKKSAEEIPTPDRRSRSADILAGYGAGVYGARKARYPGAETGVKVVDRDYGGIFLGTAGGNRYGGSKVPREFNGMETAEEEKRARKFEEEKEEELNMQDKFYMDIIG